MKAVLLESYLRATRIILLLFFVARNGSMIRDFGHIKLCFLDIYGLCCRGNNDFIVSDIYDEWCIGRKAELIEIMTFDLDGRSLVIVIATRGFDFDFSLHDGLSTRCHTSSIPESYEGGKKNGLILPFFSLLMAIIGASPMAIIAMYNNNVTV